VILDTSELAVSSQFYVSAAIAVAIANFLRKYAGENVFIKWPNDIFLNDRKAAGLLIENSIRGNTWQYAVAGMGININQKILKTFHMLLLSH